jgi:hypothetical protein
MARGAPLRSMGRQREVASVRRSGSGMRTPLPIEAEIDSGSGNKTLQSAHICRLDQARTRSHTFRQQQGSAIMLTGTCHCGECRWTLDAVPESVTACSCTICRRYGALWAYGHVGLNVAVSGESTAYRRSDGRQLEFHFCSICGCAMYNAAISVGADGHRWVAVNCRMTNPDPIASLPIDHFDGHDTWADLPRDGKTVRDMWF